MNVIELDKPCGELYKDGVYIYTTSPDFPQSGDCEHRWKSHDGTVLGYGSSLVRDYCESGIRCIVNCFNPTNETQYIFNVFNSTTEAPGLTPANVYGNAHTTSIAVSVLVVLIAVLTAVLIFLFFKKQRWRAGVRDWWQKMVRGSGQRADEENHVNPGAVRANGCVTGEEAQALKDTVTTVDERGGCETE